jgi:hypothetical protein
MEVTSNAPPAKKGYRKPRLVVYGRLEELTLTEAENNNMNDMFGNFKTQ